jgi:hypothetical protein
MFRKNQFLKNRLLIVWVKNKTTKYKTTKYKTAKYRNTKMDMNFILVIILVILIIFFTIKLCKNEHLIGWDNENYDKYGNIKTEKNVDTFDQRTFVPIEPSMGTNIDNQDVVNRAIRGQISPHTPLERGVSPSSSATMTNFYLGDKHSNINPIIREPYEVKALDMDEILARKQQHAGDKNRKALDGKIRSTKNIYQRFFADECDQNEKRVWWSAEADDYETDYDLS